MIGATSITVDDLVRVAELAALVVSGVAIYWSRRTKVALEVTKASLDMTALANGELRKEIDDEKRRAAADRERCTARLAEMASELAVLKSSFAKDIAAAVSSAVLETLEKYLDHKDKGDIR